MKLRRHSRKPCEVGCEELERTSAAEARFCNVAEMHISRWRFYRKVIQMPRLTDICFCMYTFVHCRINVLITFGTTLVHAV
jgi:hypothetical protein